MRRKPSEAWGPVLELKEGMGTVKPLVAMRLKKPDGQFCSTLAETNSVMKKRFAGVFNRDASFDESVLGSIPHRELRPELADPPTDAETRRAIVWVKSGKVAGDSGVPVEYLKAIEGDLELAGLFRRAVFGFLGRRCGV